MKFTTTYFNFRIGKPDRIISGSNTGEHTSEEIIEGIREYVESICPLEHRTDANGNDTLKIVEGARLPAGPIQISMRYS